MYHQPRASRPLEFSLCSYSARSANGDVAIGRARREELHSHPAWSAPQTHEPPCMCFAGAHLQHKRNPCFPDKHKAHGDSKTVLLYFEREDMFELDTGVLPRMSSDGVSFSDALLGCLG